ncbi:MAG: GtrA family protein [Clostridia bacterium]|jgi:putative flippase GtrA|nr:GtrA family protein [Clostridia bacterium]
MEKNVENKNEILKYTVVGIMATFINIGLYSYLVSQGMDYRLSTTIAIAVSVAFAFPANKSYVFKSSGDYKAELIKFITARVFTYLMDFVFIIVFVSLIGIDKYLSKVLVTILVIITNYLLSKKVVFKN